MIAALLTLCLVAPADEIDDLIESALHLEELGQPVAAARRWGQALSEAEGQVLREQQVALLAAGLLADDPESGLAMAMLPELKVKRVAPFLGASSLAGHVLHECTRRRDLVPIPVAAQVLMDHAKTKGSGDLADLRAEWAEGMLSLSQFEVAKAVKRFERAWEGMLEEGALEDGLHVAVELAARMREEDDVDEAVEVLETTLAALLERGDPGQLDRWERVAGARLELRALRTAAGLSDEVAPDGTDADGTGGAADGPGPEGGTEGDGAGGGADAPPAGAAPDEPPAGPATPLAGRLSARGRARTIFAVKRDQDELLLSSELTGDKWQRRLSLGPGVVAVRHGGLEIWIAGPAVALGVLHLTEPAGDPEPRSLRPLGRHFLSLADGETWRFESDGSLSVR